MSITVSVRRDRTGIWPAGYDKVVPNDIQIFGERSLPIVGTSQIQTVLEIQHPSFGTLYVAETPESISYKLNQVNCVGCGTGGGGGNGSYSKWETFVADGTNSSFTLSEAPYPGHLRLFYTGVLRDDEPFTVSGNVVTLTFVPTGGENVSFNYDTEPNSGGIPDPVDLSQLTSGGASIGDALVYGNNGWGPGAVSGGGGGDVYYAERTFWAKDYGAKEDRKYVENVTVTGSNIVTQTPTFTQADVGKYLKALKAGTQGQSFVSTIASVTSPTQAVLTAAAPTNTTNRGIVFGTNDLPAYKAMISAMSVPDAFNRTGGIIMGSNSVLFGTPDSNGNLITLPLVVNSSPSTYGNSVSIPAWKWIGGAGILPGNYGYFAVIDPPQNGPIVENFSVAGTGYIIGTESTDVGYGNLIGSRSSLFLEDIQLRNVDGSGWGGVNGFGLFGGLFVNKVIVDVDRCVVGNVRPPVSHGIIFPQVNNGCWSRADDLMVYGYNRAIDAGEHFKGGFIAAYGNKINLYISSYGHALHIDKMISQAANYAMWAESPGGVYVNISVMDVERNALPDEWFGAIADFKVNDNVRGKIWTTCFQQGLGDSQPIVDGNAPGLKIRSLIPSGALYDERYHVPPIDASLPLRYYERSLNAATTSDGQSIQRIIPNMNGVKERFLVGTSSFVGADTQVYRLDVYNTNQSSPIEGIGFMAAAISPSRNHGNWGFNKQPSTTAESDLTFGGTLTLWNLTKSQRGSLIPNPVPGMMIFQTDNTPGIRIYNGVNWVMFTGTAD